MLSKLPAGSREVRQYLMAEFGDIQEFDGCVLLPPRRAIIEVNEPLQTCHESSGDGLDQDNCIPPGIYEMGEMSAGFSSHWCYLHGLHGSHDIRFCAGYCEMFPFSPQSVYSSGSTIDWRGAKKFNPPSDQR